MSTQQTIIENEYILIGFDDRGRITSLKSKTNGREFLTYPGLEDNWRILVLGDGHPVYYVLGKDQTPVNVKRTATSITFSYQQLVREGQVYSIDIDFTASVQGEEARFDVRIRNGYSHRIREAWYPILGGFEGFEIDGQTHVVDFAKNRVVAKDILHKGLPGGEYLFVVDGETSQYYYPHSQMQWIDLSCDREGLYISSDDKTLSTTVFRLEKYPPEIGASGGDLIEPSVFPPDTPRWMNMMTGKLTAIDPGEEWQSAQAVFWPHAGDWHTAAQHYRAWTDSWMKWPQRPAWLNNYVGWHHLVGKTYLGEIYHTFDQFTEVMKETQKRCGIDVLMLYGHTNIGCEGSDYDISPAEDLGGKEGFRRMCEELHKTGMKVLIMTHRQSAINMDLPEYQRFKDWVITDRLGIPRMERWWKTTIESLLTTSMGHYEATGPVWARVCPHNDEFWLTFRDQLVELMELGLDGAQLDTIGIEGMFCYADNHGHKPGTGQFGKLAERLAWLRSEIRAINPEFLMCGEEFGDWLGQYLDLPYSRYRGDEGNQVYRYTYPEFKENAAVSAYGYHQANKSLMMGMGMNLEMWGLKKSVLTCPELMDYIDEIVRFRRAYPDYLINGRFIDTLQAQVEGNIRYSVFEGPHGLAAVLWNSGDTPQDCALNFTQQQLKQGIVWKPESQQQNITLPAHITVEPNRVAVIIAEK